MAVVDVQSTIGAVEIGVFIALFLFGIVTAQCSVYYQRFPQDPFRIKTIVRSFHRFSISLRSD